MTASTTPRLGLILPATSDTFDLDDIDNTFTILDGTPGITSVANYAALTALAATLTAAQNGGVYLQADNGSLWQWVKPGAPAGSFKKINSVGLIKTATQGAQVVTSTTSTSSGPTLISTSFTFPGGRSVLAKFFHNNIVNTGSYGYSKVDIWANGVLLNTSTENGAPTKEVTHHLFEILSPTDYAPGASVTIKISVRSTSYGGGSTTAAAGGELNIIEL